jgi:hypothetical protein
MQSIPPTLTPSQRFREEARKVRLDAERSTDPTKRRLLLEIADKYDGLADGAEHPPPGGQ